MTSTTTQQDTQFSALIRIVIVTMAGIGPELPAHLTKRKRSDPDELGDGSPPTKIHAASPEPRRTVGPTLPPHLQQQSENEAYSKRQDDGTIDDALPTSMKQDIGPSMPPSTNTNPDAIDLEDSDDDDAGPVPPPAQVTHAVTSKSNDIPPKRTMGPTFPPTAAELGNPEAIDLDDDDDDVGPALPKVRPASPTASNLTAAPIKRVMGPAMPPASLSERPPNPPSDDDSDDSDDDYGPALPGAPGAAPSYTPVTATSEASKAPEKLVRDSWMTAPPTDTGRKADPLQIKARKFNFGKGASSGPVGISSIWTETPEEKRKRLADEVLGRKEVATSSTAAPASGKGRKDNGEQEEIARRIAKYNESVRGKSLLEQRQEGLVGAGKVEEEDDPSKRAFDRERDIGGKGVGLVQKRDMLKRAGDFGSRFERGKFL
jgi:hypothetical protein